MYACEGTHSLKQSLDIWLLDPDTHSQHPHAGSVSAPRQTHVHTSSAEKVGEPRMHLFITTATAWIFQTGNLIPQWHQTQRRGLGELGGGGARSKNPRLGLAGATCLQWQTHRQGPGAGDRRSVKPYQTTSAFFLCQVCHGSSLYCGKP